MKNMTKWVEAGSVQQIDWFPSPGCGSASRVIQGLTGRCASFTPPATISLHIPMCFEALLPGLIDVGF